NDATCKVHSLLYAPTFESAAAINARLGEIGNLDSDGRPIIGLDTKELFQIILDVSTDNMLIPAHIWTPHFSVFGSQSGFDSLEECFEELTPYIAAIETGLSSDPPMNWRIDELQDRAIISNSDAHSPRKLGREATIFETETISYYEIKRVLEENDTNVLQSTIEFYPEEGKYHYDGHRKCQLRLHPKETLQYDKTCPQCGKPLTVGVMHRVEDLASYPEGHAPPKALPHKSIIPLADIISEVEGKGAQSKHVERKWWYIISQIGDEFSVLLDRTYEEIASVSSEAIANAVEQMRNGHVHIDAGYDGEYGKITLDVSHNQHTQTPLL
ncbi:MAG: endonuclease Q family protein, partial [Candidatus Paceibacteria bacterium]